MAYQLVFRSPVGEQTITLDRPIIVGRDPGCDVPIDSVRVSRRHAEFLASPGGVTVRDLGSRNGVFVNGIRIEQATIGVADRVLLGDVAVTLGSTASPAITQAPAASFAPPPSPYPPPPPTAPGSVSQGGGDKTTVLPRSAALAPAFGPAPTGPGVANAGAAVHVGASPKSLTGKLAKKAGLPVRITIAVMAASVITFLATAIPLSISHSQMVTHEALSRVSTLVRSLGAENGAALATGQTLAVTVQTALLEPGVKEAYIIGPDGRVLAPTEKLDQSFTRLDALGDLASLQGLQTAVTARDVQAAVVIETGGRRLGVAWVRLDPSFTDAGSPVWLYLAASLLTSLTVAFGIAMVLRKLIMTRLATFATDVDLAASGQMEIVTESLGLPHLAESVNFVLGRMRVASFQAPSTPMAAPDYEPTPGHAAAAAHPPPVGDGILVVDAAYLITEANPSAAHMLQTPADRLIGHHVLEAVSDQTLVTAIINIMGDLAPGNPRTQQVPGSASQPPLGVEARQGTAGGPIQITLRRMG